MESLKFNEIKVVDDAIDDMDIIKNIINTGNRENAFYIADMGGIIKKHQEWITRMPKVTPHYAIKCNANATVIKILASLNACFDCASKQEIIQAMQCGVQGEQIIFAHPFKLPSHIKYAKKMGVKQMTVDSETELWKIKAFFPEAKIVIRIRCDAKNTQILLGSKFGCEPNEEAVDLIHLTKSLNLNLHGFSFHVGTPCMELDAYCRGIKMCEKLIAIANEVGCENVQLIDIGGGFTGETEKMDKVAKIINDAIRDLDSNIRVISEPGTYYVGSNFILTSYLHSKKVIRRDGEIQNMYHMNCGVFNSFLDELLGLQSRVPELLYEPISNKMLPSTIWGPTADSHDLIVKNILLPELYIGDWLVWKNMGAYTLSLANKFNGFPIPHVIPFIRKSQWLDFLSQKKDIIQNSIPEDRLASTRTKVDQVFGKGKVGGRISGKKKFRELETESQ